MPSAADPSPGVVASVGGLTLAVLRFVGGVSLLLADALVHTVVGPFRGRPVRVKEVFRQAARIGPGSLGVVFLVNFFVGVILALIGGKLLLSLGFTRYVGDLMSMGIILELGPLLTGIILTGYIGAAFAAELGTMVVSEETTALETMALNPTRYLVAPRVLATMIMAPCVTLLGNIVGIFGGLVVAVVVLDLSPQLFFDQAWGRLDAVDIWRGLFKASVFGLIIGTVGCYQGFRVKGGAEGVGRVTTEAVVTIIIAIIVTDAILNYFLLFRLTS